MFDSFIVELVIGCITLFALLGIVTTTLTEAIQTFAQKIRSQYLLEALHRLLDLKVSLKETNPEAVPPKKGFAIDVLEHPLLKSFAPDKTSPSYIPSNLIAKVVIDILTRPQESSDQPSSSDPLDELKSKIRANIDSIQSEDLRKSIHCMYSNAELIATTQIELIEKLKAEIIHWLDAAFDRVEGLVKRNAKTVSLCVAFILCVSLNINAIDFIKGLAQDPKARTAMIDIAFTLNDEVNSKDVNSKIKSACDKEARDEKSKKAMRAEQSSNAAKAASNHSTASAASAASTAVSTASTASTEDFGCTLRKSLELIPTSSMFVLGWDYTPKFIAESDKLERWHTFFWFLYWLLGICISTLAASLGGDYWFKRLKDVIRLTGAKPNKSVK